jgi:hypothetical protein
MSWASMTMSVIECAKLLNKSPQFVRVGLQRGLLPFGVAIKMNGNKYTYHISEAKVYDYLGVKKEELPL